ncbi:MAG: ketol-acid reductoisomerase [Candidatus Binatia bacterium]
MATIFHDEDADLAALSGERIAIIGYGNQGRSQALNLRDSGLDVIVGNIGDAARERATAEGFTALDIPAAVAAAQVVMLLIPDEVMPEVYARDVAPQLADGAALSFASGYNIAFGLVAPDAGLDVVLLAPRMIGVGVRDTFVAGRGFPSFVGVHQDATGRAQARLLALAKGVGSTRAGCLEMSMADEAALDLFTEQGFGPAFGAVLTSAIEMMIEAGYPPEAVLMELYMSGELAYTAQHFVDTGIIDQMDFHSHTSQYGSMTRGVRFADIDLKSRMRAALDDIRSGAFAAEWQQEQASGGERFEQLRALRRFHPLNEWEQQTRSAFRMAKKS